MTAKELCEKYLEFFKQKGHQVIPSAPLIPENDPTVLFTTAGMHPLVPYLLGQKHPLGQRLASCQKCIRTTDIDEVGDNRHQTFFEMLGNWSLGSYFKEEAIAWSWEFLTDKKWLGLDPARLYVTVFMGDENATQDQVAINEWKKHFAKVGIKAETADYHQPIAGNGNLRIFLMPAKDNWWGPAGQTGPCGPCTEMFYDVSPEAGRLSGTFEEEVEKFRILEIWNDVFMEFNKTTEGKYEKLSQKNVDTGMGVERTISVLNGKKDSFDNELFYPLFRKIEELSGKQYNASKSSSILFKEEISFGESKTDHQRAMRIVADHIKAATFILAEGLEPSNVERGYVLRRLIRRAVRYGRQLDINGIFTFKVAEAVIEIYRDVYPELIKSREFIQEQLIKEEEKFTKTLARGLKEFQNQRSIAKSQSSTAKVISGQAAFDLYQTYGFPLELTEELAKEEGLTVDKEEFQKLFESHQEISRAGADQKFKGGLADHSEQTTKYHTATHLLLAALRKVLGEQVFQKGSNITAERLRFDFSHSQKLTPEQIKAVEDLVNQKIEEDLPVQMKEMTLEEARAQKAMGVFGTKYGERVKVYTIGQGKIFSQEICGGPHVERTGILGRFKIIKEEAVSAGVRRIKAILE